MNLDAGRAFTFVFEDHHWLPKALIGAVILLGAQAIRTMISFAGSFIGTGIRGMSAAAPGTDITMISIMIMGQLLAALIAVAITCVVWGNLVRTFANVVRGDELPMAEWNDWGGDFVTGAKVFAVMFLYAVPLLALAGASIPFFMEAAANGTYAFNSPLGAAGLVGSMVLSLFYFCFIPAPLMRFAATGQMGAAFQIGAVFKLIFGNLRNYTLAILTTLAALLFSLFGVLLLCIGIFATRYWAYLITTHVFAQVYRLDSLEQPG